jgi:anti-anti-sigma factor
LAGVQARHSTAPQWYVQAPAPFAGSIRVDDRRVVVTIAGEIDIATVKLFRELMDQAIAVGTPRVLVDMAGLEFMDGQGLAVLAHAARELGRTGGRVALHAVPARIYRVLTVSGLADELDVERSSVGTALARGLGMVSSIPVTRDVLDAALQLVVTMAQSVVGGADGVSITLPRHGRMETVAASNDVVLEMDHDQYETSEGPCLDAAAQGERFHIESLDDEKRWPRFVPRARARGINSILSTPLLSGDRPIGALNVYSRTVGAFAAHETKWTDQFAAEAATVVSSAGVDEAVAGLAAQLRPALLSREMIALAQGMVMQRDGVSAPRAHAALRAVSQRTGKPLRDVCYELVCPSNRPAAKARSAEVTSREGPAL